MIIFQPGVPRPGNKWPWKREQTWRDSDILQCVQDLGKHPPLRCLLLNNYDSYAYNLYQLVSLINGKPPYVAYNDGAKSWESLLSNIGFKPDCLVISPGPGHPDRVGDFHLCRDALQYAVDIPTLGVCLGLQGLGLTYGAVVVKRKSGPMHGRISKIYHDGSEIFAGVDQGFEAVRYHSLLVNDDSAVFQKEDCPLQVTARSEDTDIMAMKHIRYPHWGVQFHPESAGTVQGVNILQNFLDATRRFHATSSATQNKNPYAGVTVSQSSLRDNPISSTTSISGNRPKTLAPPVVKKEIDEEDRCIVPPWNSSSLLVAEAIPFDCDPECAFLELFGNDKTAWWLDSSSAVCSKTTNFELGNSHSRFSYMGSSNGCPNSEVVEYHGPGNGGLTVIKGDQVEHLTPELGIVQYLHDKLPCKREFGLVRVEMLSSNVSSPGDDVKGKEGLVGTAKDLLPFNLLGGYVGFCGYEVRHDTTIIQSREQGTRWYWPKEGMTEQAHSNKHIPKHGLGEDGKAKDKILDCGTLDSVPKSLWVQASRYIAFDHHTRTAYAVADASLEGKDKSEKLVHSTVQSLQKLLASPKYANNGSGLGREEPEHSSANVCIANKLGTSNHKGHHEANLTTLNDEWFVEPAISLEQYKEKINECLEYLVDGESYEICLTNKFKCPPLPSSDVRVGALELYKALRRNNPAPYAAFLCHENYAVCCSSPELFLRLESNGTVYSKPIKGTAPRGDSTELDDKLAKALEEDDKTVAENLMILDLIRNDIGRVCKIGSVVTPDVMKVETYPTVHHLVSTICGELEEDYSPVDLFAATFPGGSMTGAPKERTLAILQDLENSPRGVYSGSIGFFSLDGACVLNIVIRTAVVTGNGISVGAGGAITSSSDVDDECDEALLKAQTVLSSVEATYSRLKKKLICEKKKETNFHNPSYNGVKPQFVNETVIENLNVIRRPCVAACNNATSDMGG